MKVREFTGKFAPRQRATRRGNSKSEYRNLKQI